MVGDRAHLLQVPTDPSAATQKASVGAASPDPWTLPTPAQVRAAQILT